MRELMTTAMPIAVSDAATQPGRAEGVASELERLFGRRLITEAELAQYTTQSRQMAAMIRKDGTGPRFVRLGKRRLAYRIADIEEWLKARENVPAEA